MHEQGEDPVVVLDYELPLVSHAFEFRAPGIWTDFVCETPIEQWTIGLEAFGIAVDPDDVIHPATFGDRTPIGLDLDVEAASAPDEHDDGFEHEVTVRGEVPLGVRRTRLMRSGPSTPVGGRWPGRAAHPRFRSADPHRRAVARSAIAGDPRLDHEQPAGVGRVARLIVGPSLSVEALGDLRQHHHDHEPDHAESDRAEELITGRKFEAGSVDHLGLVLADHTDAVGPGPQARSEPSMRPTMAAITVSP